MNYVQTTVPLGKSDRQHSKFAFRRTSTRPYWVKANYTSIGAGWRGRQPINN